MMRRPLAVRLLPPWSAALAVVFVLCGTARAAEDTDPKLPFERYSLPNGLEVILHQDKSVPLVAVELWYHVGSGDEVPGKSGFAHLFEHMMFQGSQHTGEDAHFKVLQKIGATSVNATTNSDRTNYFEVVPSQALETALWLESDRMGYLLPLLTEQSLNNQRDVVRNERRQNYDNVPYGKDRFAVAAALYPEGHPYRYLTIGKHEDVQNASLVDVRAFFQKWYVPANATVALVGDFEIAEARRLVEKWFGSFPRLPRPARREVPTPLLSARKREVISDDFAKLRRVHYAWHAPKRYAAGAAELEILASALGAPGTGRLYKILVHDRQLAQSISVSLAGAQMTGVFHLIADLKSGADMAEVERVIDEELDRVRREPISKREFDRAVTAVQASFVWGLERLRARAGTLQEYNHYVGDPDYIGRDLLRFRKTTGDAVRDAAARYLGTRVEIITAPQGGN